MADQGVLSYGNQEKCKLRKFLENTMEDRREVIYSYLEYASELPELSDPIVAKIEAAQKAETAERRGGKHIQRVLFKIQLLHHHAQYT